MAVHSEISFISKTNVQYKNKLYIFQILLECITEMSAYIN